LQLKLTLKPSTDKDLLHVLAEILRYNILRFLEFIIRRNSWIQQINAEGTMKQVNQQLSLLLLLLLLLLFLRPLAQSRMLKIKQLRLDMALTLI